MAKYITLGQLKTQLDTMFRSLKAYLDDTLTAPVRSLAQQAKALADEVVRRADEGEFKGDKGEKGEKGDRGEDGSDGVWGGITGDLSDQTDLVAALEEAAYDDTDLSGRVTVLEGKESGWDAKYSKPSGGIPKTDLASAVRTSLGKADSALQDAPTDGKRYDRQSGAWAEAPMFSSPNLLDNAWFTVNQRGATTLPDTNGAYHVDRWRAWTASGSIGANGITVSSGTIYQNLEGDLWDSLVGKTLVCSILLSDGTIKASSPLLFNGATAFFEGEFTAQMKADEKTFEFTYVGAIRAVKLEIGAISTLGRDAMPSYAEELLKCQRYFWCIRTTGSRNSILWSGLCQNATDARFTIFTPVPMRITPTVTISALNRLRIGSVSGETVLLTNATLNVFNLCGGSDPGYNAPAVGLTLSTPDAAYTPGTPCYVRNTNQVNVMISADL